MTHLTDGEVEGFAADKLSNGGYRRVVSHLLTGCLPCRARLTRYGDLLFPCAPEARKNGDTCRQIERSYTGALQRAWEGAQSRLGEFQPVDEALEALWSESFEARFEDPPRMMRLAYEAADMAESLNPATLGAGVVADLKARAWAEYGNSLRVNSRLVEAEQFLGKAKELAEDGTGDPLLAARLTDYRASLRIDQRRMGEAWLLLDEVERCYRDLDESHLAGRAKISQGSLAYYDGDPELASRLVHEGLAMLEPGRDPTLEALAEKNLISFLADAGRYTRAAELLLRSGLRQRLMSKPLPLARLRLIEGKIAAGMGRLERASQAFNSVRQEFLQLGRSYEAAIIGLELAAVWLRLGRLSDFRGLAENTFKAFSALGVGPEAQKALEYLREVCGSPQPPLTAFTSVSDFLSRLDFCPDLVFRRPA